MNRLRRKKYIFSSSSSGSGLYNNSNTIISSSNINQILLNTKFHLLQQELAQTKKTLEILNNELTKVKTENVKLKENQLFNSGTNSPIIKSIATTNNNINTTGDENLSRSLLQMNLNNRSNTTPSNNGSPVLLKVVPRQTSSPESNNSPNRSPYINNTTKRQLFNTNTNNATGVDNRSSFSLPASALVSSISSSDILPDYGNSLIQLDEMKKILTFLINLKDNEELDCNELYEALTEFIAIRDSFDYHVKHYSNPQLYYTPRIPDWITKLIHYANQNKLNFKLLQANKKQNNENINNSATKHNYRLLECIYELCIENLNLILENCSSSIKDFISPPTIEQDKLYRNQLKNHFWILGDNDEEYNNSLFNCIDLGIKYYESAIKYDQNNNLNKLEPDQLDSALQIRDKFLFELLEEAIPNHQLIRDKLIEQLKLNPDKRYNSLMADEISYVNKFKSVQTTQIHDPAINLLLEEIKKLNLECADEMEDEKLYLIYSNYLLNNNAIPGQIEIELACDYFKRSINIYQTNPRTTQGNISSAVAVYGTQYYSNNSLIQPLHIFYSLLTHQYTLLIPRYKQIINDQQIQLIEEKERGPELCVEHISEKLIPLETEKVLETKNNNIPNSKNIDSNSGIENKYNYVLDRENSPPRHSDSLEPIQKPELTSRERSLYNQSKPNPTQQIAKDKLDAANVNRASSGDLFTIPIVPVSAPISTTFLPDLNNVINNIPPLASSGTVSMDVRSVDRRRSYSPVRGSSDDEPDQQSNTINSREYSEECDSFLDNVNIGNIVNKPSKALSVARERSLYADRRNRYSSDEDDEQENKSRMNSNIYDISSESDTENAILPPGINPTYNKPKTKPRRRTSRQNIEELRHNMKLESEFRAAAEGKSGVHYNISSLPSFNYYCRKLIAGGDLIGIEANPGPPAHKNERQLSNIAGEAMGQESSSAIYCSGLFS